MRTISHHAMYLQEERADLNSDDSALESEESDLDEREREGERGEGEDEEDEENETPMEKARTRPTCDWLKLGELSLRLGDAQEAESAFQRAVACRPPSYTAWRYLLIIALAEDRAEEAILACDEICCYISDDGDGTVHSTHVLWGGVHCLPAEPD